MCSDAINSQYLLKNEFKNYNQVELLLADTFLAVILKVFVDRTECSRIGRSFRQSVGE